MQVPESCHSPLAVGRVPVSPRTANTPSHAPSHHRCLRALILKHHGRDRPRYPCSPELTGECFILFKLLFLSLDERTSPQPKREVPVCFSAGPKTTPSSTFQGSKDRCSAAPPCPSSFLSQRASSALPLACVKGLYLFEVPLRLFINMTNDGCVEPLVKVKDSVTLDNYTKVLKGELLPQRRLQSKYNRETRRNIRTVDKHNLTVLLSLGNTSACFCSCSTSW